MNDLARHIETLLLENDCVIVPGLGGFVAHYNPATRIEAENVFLPPTRVIGFNPQLKMNDGLLAQSYMAVYGTTFSDATRMIDRQVEKLIDSLHENGKAVLPNIGEIHYTIHGTYDFAPYDSQVTTPALYGLDCFEMKPLAELQKEKAGRKESSPLHTPVAPTVRFPQKHTVRRLNRAFLSNAAALIAAVIMFFLFSVPIENTETIQGNYAQLLPAGIFEQIGKSSLVTTPISEPDAALQTAKRKASAPQSQLRPATADKPGQARKVTAREVKVKELQPQTTLAKKQQAAASPTTPAQAAKEVKKAYHIIVASMGTEKDAQDMADRLKQNGYSGASAIIGNGKMRVSIESFATQAEAYQRLQVVRQTQDYENAWVLKY